MKDFEYSNLNIVEMNDFLRADTDNYKNFQNSLCGTAYILETKTISEDKMIVNVVSNQIKMEEKTFEEKKEQILENNKNLSFFSKIFGSNKKELKILEDEHKNLMNELNSRLNHHQTLLETHTLMLQEIKDKLQEKGFNWSEMKRLIEEKMRQGLLFLNFQSQSNKPKVKIPTEEDYDITEFMLKMKKKMSENVDATENSIRERNFYSNDPNKVDLSIFNPFERTEYERLLKYYNYNRERLREVENARMLRRCMFMGDEQHHRHFRHMTSSLSDFAFGGLFDFIFGNDGKDFSKCHAKCMVAIDSKDTKKMREMNEFIKSKATKLLADSGYKLNEIEKKLPYVEKELKNLCCCPERINEIVKCSKCSHKVLEMADKEYVSEMVESAKESAKQVEIEKTQENTMERVLEKDGPNNNYDTKK